MTDPTLEAVIREATISLERATEELLANRAEIQRLKDENAKLLRKLNKTRQTIRRMEEGEL